MSATISTPNVIVKLVSDWFLKSFEDGCILQRPKSSSDMFCHSLHTPGCGFIPLPSHISPEGGSVGVINPLFELLSLPPAIWHSGDPRSLRRIGLPWLLPPVLAFGPPCSTLKWNVCPLSSMPSTTLKGRGWRGKKLELMLQSSFFNYHRTRNPGMGHESCGWHEPMWARGDKPNLEGRTPELSEPAVTHI